MLFRSQSYSLSYEFFLSSSTKVIGSQMTAFPSNTMVNFEISPFSYMEYISLESLENGLNSYKNYFNGRYIFSSNIKEVVPNTVWCSYLKNSILYKDIIQKYRIKDSYLLESVFLYVCQHISELVSVNTIVKHFKDKGVRSSYETVASYLLYLEEAYLIHRADRYQVKSRELISGSSKYYINSWSLIAHVYPFINYSDDVKLRNEVFLGLIRREYKVYVGVSKSKIIDFVAQKNDRIIYFQCISSIFDQGLLHSIYSSLQSIQDHYEKWIISLDNEVQPSKDGIRHVQAWNLDSLL